MIFKGFTNTYWLLMVSVLGTYKGWGGGECVGEFQEVKCGCDATSLFCVCSRIIWGRLVGKLPHHTQILCMQISIKGDK